MLALERFIVRKDKHFRLLWREHTLLLLKRIEMVTFFVLQRLEPPIPKESYLAAPHFHIKTKTIVALHVVEVSRHNKATATLNIHDI